MIIEKTRQEWQQIVSNYIPEKQSQKSYCKERSVNYNSFRYWYYKLKPLVGFAKKEQAAQKVNVLPEATKEIVNKEFIGFKLVPSITKIKLPNGINVEIATGDIFELIKKLYHVA
jgi:hypothetical protein